MQWLPELARMPTEWIHHPWDAPLAVLKAAGVELGLNYPKPIIDIELARDRLTEAILIMRQREVAARAEKLDGTDEVVCDNSEYIDTSAIPIVILKEKASCPSTSSHDQQVPSMQNIKNGLFNWKRLYSVEEEEEFQKNVQVENGEGETSKVDDDLCSTAVSSSVKKQKTCSLSSFSVPQSCSASSDLKQPCPVDEREGKKL